MYFVLSRSEHQAQYQPGSPIESRMMAILDGGPGVGSAGGFLPPMGWRDAVDLVRSDPDIFQRRPIIVVPQAEVGRRRADMLVLTRSRAVVACDVDKCEGAFFIECDGHEHHSASPTQICDDIERQREIQRVTGFDILRFSGAEINFRPVDIEHVLAARIEATHALQEFGQLIEHEAQRVFCHVTSMTLHPALRPNYNGRNSPRAESRYAHHDPRGDEYQLLNDFDPDPFEALHDSVARLRHAAARCRTADYESVDENDHRGFGFRSLRDILASVITTAARQTADRST